MRFFSMPFLRNAVIGTSKTSFLRAQDSQQSSQFGVVDLERARPKRRLRDGDVRKKITLKKMTAEVSKIKLVKWHYPVNRIKYTDDIVLVKYLLFIKEKMQLRYNKNLT